MKLSKAITIGAVAWGAVVTTSLCLLLATSNSSTSAEADQVAQQQSQEQGALDLSPTPAAGNDPGVFESRSERESISAQPVNNQPINNRPAPVAKPVTYREHAIAQARPKGNDVKTIVANIPDISFATYHKHNCEKMAAHDDMDGSMAKFLLASVLTERIAVNNSGLELPEQTVDNVAEALVRASMGYGCNKSVETRMQTPHAQTTKTQLPSPRASESPALKAWTSSGATGHNVVCIHDGFVNIRTSPNREDSSIKAVMDTGNCGNATETIENGFMLVEFNIDQLGEERSYWVHETQVK